MATESQGAPGLEYEAFRKRVEAEFFTGQQSTPLKHRLELLESFMDRPAKAEQGKTTPVYADSKAGRRARNEWLAQQDRERVKEKESKTRVWDCEPGSLTIVDLSCPFVDANSACALFSICVDLFLENRSRVSRIIALDEAHKVNLAASFGWSTLSATYSS